MQAAAADVTSAYAEISNSMATVKTQEDAMEALKSISSTDINSVVITFNTAVEGIKKDFAR